MLISGIGLISGLMQFCSEKREEGEKYQLLMRGFIIGVLFNSLLSILIFIFIYEFLTTVFRVNRENKKYSLLLNINTISYFILASCGAYFYGIDGTIFGRYLAYSISILIGAWMCRDYIKQIVKAARIKDRIFKTLIKYSFLTCISNSISRLLFLLDVYMIGLFTISEELIAGYKAATMIPTALSFIPTCIIIFIYPYFAERNTDYSWIKKNVRKLLKYLVFVNVFISLGLFIGAPLIMKVFGNEYQDSVLIFRILAINYFFLSSFRIPCGNILSMMRKINVNLMINIISGVANIALNIVLIRLYGGVGAAIATFAVVLISSIIGYFYLITFLNKRIKN